MDVSDSTQVKHSGNFWDGLLLPVAGWAVDFGLTTLIYSLAIFNYNDTSRPFSIFTGLSGIFAVFLAVIWLPVAIIAGFRSRTMGIKATLPLVLVTFIIAPILVGCGFGFLVGLYG